MLKPIAQFISTIAGKTGQFLLDHDTPLEAAKSMLLEFIKDVSMIEEQAKAMHEALKAQENAVKAAEVPQDNPKVEQIEQPPIDQPLQEA